MKCYKHIKINKITLLFFYNVAYRQLTSTGGYRLVIPINHPNALYLQNHAMFLRHSSLPSHHHLLHRLFPISVSDSTVNNNLGNSSRGPTIIILDHVKLPTVPTDQHRPPDSPVPSSSRFHLLAS